MPRSSEALPFDEGDRLYTLSWQNRLGRRIGTCRTPSSRTGAPRAAASPALAAYSNAPMNISDDRAAPEEASGTWLTVNTFGVLRQPPLLGRDFTPHDGRRGRRAGRHHRPRALEEPLRRRSAACSAARCASTGEPATIVGVMPEGMRFPGRHRDLAAVRADRRADGAQRPSAPRLRPPARRRRSPRGAGGIERHRAGS